MANKAISLEQMSRIWGKVKTYVASAISGLYTKPSGGIPKSDLSTEVQTSLGKADTALQTHQDISGKQDVISDLATIRSGAALGATAIQQHQDISGKQDVISDLATIRSGASAGATALQPNDLADWAKQPTRPTYTANDTGALPNTTTLADLEDATHKTVTPDEKAAWNAKQDLLESGTNIKTISGFSILGSGSIFPVVYDVRYNAFSLKAKGNFYKYSLVFEYSESELIGSAQSYSTATDKTLNTLDFNPFGLIGWSDSSNKTDGQNIGGGDIYVQRANADFRYAFNTGTSLTQSKAVYVKCEPLVDGSNNRTGRVRFATGQPIVQDLPTTADGYVYIYIGIATSSGSNVMFAPNHPVYEYRNGGIKLWIGD